MPFLKTKVADNSVMARFGGGALPATLGQTLDATIDDPLLRPAGLVGTELEIAREEGDIAVGPQLPGPFQRMAADDENVDRSPLIEPEAANQRYKELGLKFDSPVRERTAEIMAEQKREEIMRNDILARGPQGLGAKALQLGAALAGAATDPINIASAFVPVVSSARLAGLTARLGTTGARSAAGVTEGTVGASLVEPIVLSLAQQQQLDYEMSDALVNIALGGILGGGLHVATGAAADALRRAGSSTTPPAIEDLSGRGRETALRSSTAQLAHGADVDVTPVVAIDRALSARQRALSSTALSAGEMARDIGRRTRIVDAEQRARTAAPKLFERLDATTDQLGQAERRLAELEKQLSEPENPVVAASARLTDLDQRIATTTDQRKLRRLTRERQELIDEAAESDVHTFARRERQRRSRAQTESRKTSERVTELRRENGRLRRDADRQIERARGDRQRRGAVRLSSRVERGPELADVLSGEEAAVRSSLDAPKRFEERATLSRANAEAEEAPKEFDQNWLDKEVEFYGGFVDDIGEGLTAAERASLDEAEELVTFSETYERGIRAGAFCLGRNL